MNKPTLKQIDIVKLAAKISSNQQGAPELMLLDRIHELEDKAANLKQEIASVTIELERQLENVQKMQGPTGETGPQGESIVGPKGDKGDRGERGPKGDKGDSIVGPAGRDGIDGRDGKDGRDGIDGKDGNIKDLSPDEIRNSLELLQGDERLDKSAIKGLEEEFKKISYRGGGTSQMGVQFIMSKIFKHQKFSVSSATTTLTLNNRVAGNVVIWLRYQGQMQHLGDQYSISGTTITLLFTPEDDTFVEVSYLIGI